MLTLAGRSWLVVHFSEAYSQGTQGRVGLPLSSPAPFKAGEGWPAGPILITGFAGLGRWFRAFVRPAGGSILILQNNVEQRTMDM